MLHGQRNFFIVYVRANGISKDIAEDAETRFDASHCELKRPLLKGNNQKNIGLMNNELYGKIMNWFAGYRYLIDNDS